MWRRQTLWRIDVKPAYLGAAVPSLIEPPTLVDVLQGWWGCRGVIAPPQPIARRIAITSPVARNSSSLGCFFPPSSSPSELVISPLNESLCARLKSHLHPSLLIISPAPLSGNLLLVKSLRNSAFTKSSHAFQPVIIFLIIYCFYKLVVNLFCLYTAFHSFRRVFRGTDVVEYKRSQYIQ